MEKLNLQAGFLYHVDVLEPDGRVTQGEDVHNLVPAEGLNHILATEFKGGAQVGTWYLGIFEGNYTPVGTDTAATFPGTATESTAYGEATRVAYVPGAVAGGTMDNAASVAQFTMNAPKTIYGGFLASQPAKGATTGVLGSAVKFTSPKVLDVGAVLRITAGFVLTSS